MWWIIIVVVIVAAVAWWFWSSTRGPAEGLSDDSITSIDEQLESIDLGDLDNEFRELDSEIDSL